MWRPENWEREREAILQRYAYIKSVEHKILFKDGFEAGASAMLGALKSQEHQDWLATPKGESCNGRWVFIPDKEDGN